MGVELDALDRGEIVAGRGHRRQPLVAGHPVPP
jgi:hypothetical protein